MNLVIEELGKWILYSRPTVPAQDSPKTGVLNSLNASAANDTPVCVPSRQTHCSSTLDTPASLCPVALALHQHAHLKPHP